MNKTISFIQMNFWLVFLAVFYIFYCLWIFQYAYVTACYICPDAVVYLHEAEALVHGYGFNLTGAAGGYYWFAAFPIGYPALIALVTLILQPLNTFLCSKILAMILVGTVLLFFAIRYKEDSWLYALLLLNLGVIHIYTNSWSENPFIPALIFYAAAISKVITAEKCRIKDYILLYITIVSVFLFRYFGILVLLFSGIIWVYFLIRYILNRKSGEKLLLHKLISLAVTGVCSAATEGAYLLMNRKFNGYATGIARSVMLEDPEVLRHQLYDSFREEIMHILYKHDSPIFSYYMPWAGLVFMIAVFGLLIFILIKHRKLDEPAVFILLGIFYYVVFVIIRFRSTMAEFSFRFFAPASLLILIGLLTLYREKLKSLPLNAISYIICFTLMLGVLSILWQDRYLNTEYTSYNVMRNEVLSEYTEVPPHSCVLNNLSDYRAIYFREDLDVNANIDPNESWEQMLERMSCYEHIYISKESAHAILDLNTFSDSVNEHLTEALNSDNTDSLFLDLTPDK